MGPFGTRRCCGGPEGPSTFKAYSLDQCGQCFLTRRTPWSLWLWSLPHSRRPARERLFPAVIALLDPHARQPLQEINTHLMLGRGEMTASGVRRRGDGVDAIWALPWLGHASPLHRGRAPGLVRSARLLHRHPSFEPVLGLSACRTWDRSTATRATGRARSSTLGRASRTSLPRSSPRRCATPPRRPM